MFLCVEVLLLTSAVCTEVEQSQFSCTARETSTSKQTTTPVGEHWKQMDLSSPPPAAQEEKLHIWVVTERREIKFLWVLGEEGRLKMEPDDKCQRLKMAVFFNRLLILIGKYHFKLFWLISFLNHSNDIPYWGMCDILAKTSLLPYTHIQPGWKNEQRTVLRAEFGEFSACSTVRNLEGN